MSKCVLRVYFVEAVCPPRRRNSHFGRRRGRESSPPPPLSSSILLDLLSRCGSATEDLLIPPPRQGRLRRGDFIHTLGGAGRGYDTRPYLWSTRFSLIVFRCARALGFWSSSHHITHSFDSIHSTHSFDSNHSTLSLDSLDSIHSLEIVAASIATILRPRAYIYIYIYISINCLDQPSEIT